MFGLIARRFMEHARAHPEILPVTFFMTFSPVMAVYMMGHTMNAPDVFGDKAERQAGVPFNAAHAAAYDHAPYDVRPGHRGWSPNTVFDKS